MSEERRLKRRVWIFHEDGVTLEIIEVYESRGPPKPKGKRPRKYKFRYPDRSPHSYEVIAFSMKQARYFVTNEIWRGLGEVGIVRFRNEHPPDASLEDWYSA